MPLLLAQIEPHATAKLRILGVPAELSNYTLVAAAV